MPPRQIDDPKQWRDRAAEMRALSDTMKNNETKLIMLRLADDYDKLGHHAEARDDRENNQKETLEIAAGEIAQGKVVAPQRERIARKAEDNSTLDHEHTLQAFISTLDILVDRNRSLLAKTPPRIEAISERAERLASLLTLSYEPMLVWELNGAIEFWNTGAERLYGFAPGEAALATFSFKQNSRSHLTR